MRTCPVSISMQECGFPSRHRIRFERILEVIENSAGDVEKAAEAEQQVAEELRQMGNEVLHGWARRQEQKKENKFNNAKGVNRKGKKPLLVHKIWENRFHPHGHPGL
jgi:hypothetical protein